MSERTQNVLFQVFVLVLFSLIVPNFLVHFLDRNPATFQPLQAAVGGLLCWIIILGISALVIKAPYFRPTLTNRLASVVVGTTSFALFFYGEVLLYAAIPASDQPPAPWLFHPTTLLVLSVLLLAFAWGVAIRRRLTIPDDLAVIYNGRIFYPGERLWWWPFNFPTINALPTRTGVHISGLEIHCTDRPYKIDVAAVVVFDLETAKQRNVRLVDLEALVAGLESSISADTLRRASHGTLGLLVSDRDTRLSGERCGIPFSLQAGTLYTVHP